MSVNSLPDSTYSRRDLALWTHIELGAAVRVRNQVSRLVRKRRLSFGAELIREVHKARLVLAATRDGNGETFEGFDLPVERFDVI